MTTTTTDRAALWAGVLAAPHDAAPKLAMCDFLEESGQDPDLLAGLKWCLAHDKWPHDDTKTSWGTWAWYPDSTDRDDVGDSMVPAKTWEEIREMAPQKPTGFMGAESIHVNVLVRRLGRAVRALGEGA
jgi:uncharacterized protein (TIGR02996 family)